MKLRLSIALNIVLGVLSIALVWQIISMRVGDYYYRKMIGGLAAGAVSEMDHGRTDAVRKALATIPSDPNDKAIIEASKAIGVMQR